MRLDEHSQGKIMSNVTCPHSVVVKIRARLKYAHTVTIVILMFEYSELKKI